MKIPDKPLTMTDFVLWLGENYNDEDYPEPFALYVIEYAKFLKQPLKLGMFIPCDKEGKPLKYPKIDRVPSQINVNLVTPTQELLDYQDAEQEVLFEGWKIGNPEPEGFYLNYQRLSNMAFWNMKEEEFELRVNRSLKAIENIEQLITHIPDIQITNNYYKPIFNQQ